MKQFGDVQWGKRLPGFMGATPAVNQPEAGTPRE